MGTGQNFTKGKFCTKTNLHEGTKLHEENLAQGSILHELQFCTEGYFFTRVK